MRGRKRGRREAHHEDKAREEKDRVEIRKIENG